MVEGGVTDATILRQASAPLAQDAVWTPDVFHYDANASRSSGAPGELDITGRARILVYGPYLVLSPGIWRTSVRFLVNETAGPKAFRIDWGTPTEFTSAPMLPGRPGIFEMSIEHEWHLPAPAEIRILLMEGAFDGQLHFFGANVTRVTSV